MTCKRFSLLFALMVAALAFAPARADVIDIQPSQDSYVSKASKATNYGSATTMSVGRAGTNTQTRSLVQFDVSSVIPAGSTINSATLRLYLESHTVILETTHDVYEVTSTWTEGGVNWNNQPSVGAVMDTITPGTVLDWKVWTVTASVVKGWLDTPATNYGMMVRVTTENDNFGYWYYATKENASNQPILRVDYTVAGCAALSCDSINVAPSATECEETEQTFTLNYSGGVAPYTVQWDWTNDSVYDATGNDYAYTYLSAGSYVAKAKVTDSCASPGPQNCTLTVPITINALPDATFTANPNPVCTTDPVNFSATAGGLNYSWDFDDGTGEDSTQQSPSYTYGVDNTYTARLTVTDPGTGCTNTSTQSIVVQAASCGGCPAITGVSIQSIAPDPECEGVSRTFTAATAGGGQGTLSYHWDFEDDSVFDMTGQTVSYAYPSAVGSPFTVRLQVRDQCGPVQTVDDTSTATVDALPDASFTANPNPVCTTDPVNFSATAAGLNYSWDFDDGTGEDSTQQSPSYTYGVDNTYTARLTVTDPGTGCTNTSTQSIVVQAASCAAPTVTVTPADLAPGAVTQGKTDVAMERLAVATDFGTASWTEVKVDLYTTTTAADGDIAAVKVYNDAGPTTGGTFDPGDGDSEIGSGTFSGGTVTITFGAPQTITDTTSYFYIVFDIACASTVGNRVGIQIVDETYFTMDEAVSSANMPFNSLDSPIVAPLMSVTPANLAPASVTQGDLDVAMERMAMATDYCSVSWTDIRVDLFTTGVAFDTDVATDGVKIYDDDEGGASPGSFDGGDFEIGSGTFSGGTVAITLTAAQVITTTSQDFFIVFNIDAAAVVGHKVGIRIADETYFTTTGTVNDGFIPFNSTDSEIVTTGGIVPDQVTDFDASDGEDSQSTLTWTNPPNPELTEVVVRSKTTSFPVDNTDGTQAYLDSSPTAGAKVSTVDSPLVNGTTYYYAVFGKSSDNEWNDSVDAGKNADTGLPQAAEDPSAPTVLILSPVDGSVVGGTVTIKISAFDADNLAAVDPIVQVSFDGAAWSNATLNANYPNDATKGIYEYVWDTTATVGADVEVAQPIFYRGTDTNSKVSPVRVATVTVRNSGGLPMGDGTLLRRANDAQLCMDCHALSTHTSELIDTGYGAWAVNCRTCHTPHSTRNIYLVREKIKTPNSGYRDVLFEVLDGTAGVTSGVMADDSDSVQTNICEVCHTKTKYHRNDAGHPNPGHKNAQDCTSCHPHGEGFKASGGDGGADCDTCHSDLTTALGDNTAKYHHYLQNFSMATPYPTDALFDGTETESADRRCLMCHVDHNIFSPDLNPLNTFGRSYNLRTDVTVQSTPDTPAVGNYTNTDFIGGAGNGGICISCHQNEQIKNTAKQADDGTTKTPVIDKASYDASAHDYATPTSTFTDSSVFNANCSRCHIDTKSPNKSGVDAQSGSTYKFGLHDSDLRRLVSDYGDAGATDPYEEGMCYNCHAATDEFYGVVAMSAGAKGIEAAFGSTYTHPVDLTSGVHLPYGEGESKGWNPAGSRHVECGDCHDPHVAQAGNHTPGAGGIGLCNLGARGVTLDPATVASDSTFRSVAYTGYTDTPTEQYQICLLCHSEWGWNATPPDTLSQYPGTTGVLPQTDVGKDFDVDNYAFHPLFAIGRNQPPDDVLDAKTGSTKIWDSGSAGDGDKYDPGDGTGTGLSNTFVDGWGQKSLVTCTDCHSYSDPLGVGPQGPHGSAYRWLLKGVDITVTVTLVDMSVVYPNMGTGYDTGVPDTDDADDYAYTRENFCINCHRGDVYGWGLSATPAYDELSRLTHGGATAGACLATDLETGKGTTYPIGCLNCHGGLSPGEIHGSIRGVGTYGSSAMGLRFTNGTSWAGHDLGDDDPEEIGCYTPGNTSELNTCVKHPGSKGGTTTAPNYYYDYPGH